MSAEISRLDFLRGRHRGTPEACRAEPEDVCVVGVRIDSKCLDIIGTTCRLCEDACDEFAIRFQLATKGRALPLIDADLCTGCEDCLEVCPVGALHPLYEIEETVS